MIRSPAPNGLTKASLRDTLAFAADVAIPTIGKGVIIRRPRIVALADRVGLDSRAVKRMQRLRARYGTGPLLLPIPGRRQAVILSPDDAHRVLDGTPEPFAPGSTEKRYALSHFEPDASLISHGPEREERRALNDTALESACPVHSLAGRLLAVVDEEAGTLLARIDRELTWEAFITAWYASVRRIVLGDSARQDHELTDVLAKLRAAGNWGFFHPGRERLRAHFHRLLDGYLRRAEPGSLASLVASASTTQRAAPADQVAHWLFAFDPGGMATLRALALLASHPGQAERARQEMQQGADPHRPLLRASILEALRLWPTTPVILRETTAETEWGGRVMPSNTNVIVFAPYFHRDDENLEYAHRFEPDLWLQDDPGGRWALIPFSGGAGICPGRHLVTMLGSAMLAAIMRGRTVKLQVPKGLGPDQALPGTLDNYSLRFSL